MQSLELVVPFDSSTPTTVTMRRVLGAHVDQGEMRLFTLKAPLPHDVAIEGVGVRAMSPDKQATLEASGYDVRTVLGFLEVAIATRQRYRLLKDEKVIASSARIIDKHDSVLCLQDHEGAMYYVKWPAPAYVLQPETPAHLMRDIKEIMQVMLPASFSAGEEVAVSYAIPRCLRASMSYQLAFTYGPLDEASLSTTRGAMVAANCEIHNSSSVSFSGVTKLRAVDFPAEARPRPQMMYAREATSSSSREPYEPPAKDDARDSVEVERHLMDIPRKGMAQVGVRGLSLGERLAVAAVMDAPSTESQETLHFALCLGFHEKTQRFFTHPGPVFVSGTVPGGPPVTGAAIVRGGKGFSGILEDTYAWHTDVPIPFLAARKANVELETAVVRAHYEIDARGAPPCVVALPTQSREYKPVSYAFEPEIPRQSAETVQKMFGLAFANAFDVYYLANFSQKIVLAINLNR